MKKKIIIGCILFLGLALRSYHINFPSIGYHNMKENEYLSMAQEMLKSNDFVTRKIYFYNGFDDKPAMRLYPQVPLVSYQIILSWDLLGKNLWGPRLFNILFGVFSVFVVYLIALELFGNTALSLFCAFLCAIMPLAVFFSRNLQPESPALFFMLLGNLFYLRFLKSFKGNYLIWGGWFFVIAWLYKFSFLIGLAPFLLCLPFKKIFKNKNFVKSFLTPYLGMGVIILLLIYFKQWEFDRHETFNRVKLFDIFSHAYWKNNAGIIWWYITEENFTPVFSLTALCGTVIALVRKKELLGRYIIGWALSIIIYSMVFSDYINQHNYYQMPFLGLICISCAYAVEFITSKIKDLRLGIIMFSFVILSLPFVFMAITRMYGVSFLGTDVAGDSLKEFTLPTERVFLLTHCQGHGIARYSQRYCGWPQSLEELIQKENKFNIKYACVSPEEYLNTNSLRSQYLKENWHIKELGFAEKTIKYLILEKGGKLNIKDFWDTNADKIRLSKKYEILGREINFYTMREYNNPHR